MRFFIISLLSWASAVAHADQNDPMLDDLFAQLRNGTTEPEVVQNDIELAWMTAPEMGVQVLVTRLISALEMGDDAVAGVLADHLTGIAPSFSEGWMLRGHVAAMQEDNAGAEIYYGRALALEPRQFHALAALGDLALVAGDKDDAYQFYRRALDINPYLADVREAAEQLRFELVGQEI